MKTLRDFLRDDPLIASEAKLKQQEGWDFFGEYLLPSVDTLWLRILSNFTRDVPLRYWDRSVIQKALQILEADKQRTIQAFAAWKNRIGVGFESLFRRASVERYEEGLSTSKSADLILLANEFHPEYLRRCESIYANLVILYWAILKKKSVQGKFDISAASSLLSSKKCEILTDGYNEEVRNGIAHGQVVFGWDEIRYGDSNRPFKMHADDFLHLFDTLFRTSNSIAIAVLLFLANNQNLVSAAKGVLPIPLIVLIASAGVERRDLTILGAVESDFQAGGKQLHISVKMGFINRASVMLDCARTALRLMDAGAIGYSRYLFDIQQNDGINSLLGIKLDKLQLLQNESYERFPEVLDVQLLWKDEHPTINLLKAFRLSFVSNAQFHFKEFIRNVQRQGLLLARDRFYIKRIENSSAGGVARVHIYVTLKCSEDAGNKTIVRAIAQEVTKRFQKRRFPTNPSRLGKRYNWKKYPKYVWISLYRFEGTIRWVISNGWLGQNLIATVERCDKKSPPIFVKKVDEVWNGMRFQYSMDTEAVAKSMVDMLNFAHEVQQSRKLQDEST